MREALGDAPAGYVAGESLAVSAKNDVGRAHARQSGVAAFRVEKCQVASLHSPLGIGYRKKRAPQPRCGHDGRLDRGRADDMERSYAESVSARLADRHIVVAAGD